MRKISLFILITTLIFSACKKETAKCPYQNLNITAPTAEKDSLQRYVNINAPAAQRDTSGVFYVINSPGSGATPEVCSYITLTYNGTLLSNGNSFTNGVQPGNFNLGDLIPGWQKGLPKIQAGGNITLYIPPSLAYGTNANYDANGNVTIPANSYLKFVIALTEVK